MSSPSELQKLIVTTVNENYNLTEMLPELFDPKVVTPTAPKPSLFKTIFSTTPLDREQLCKHIVFGLTFTKKIYKIYFQVGETSGKPSVMIVRNNPLDCEVNKATKELSELQKVFNLYNCLGN